MYIIGGISMGGKPKKTVGDLIKELRESQGLSIRKLSKLSNVGQATISDIESNATSRSLTINSLGKLCGALGITLIEFFKGLDGEELPYPNSKNTPPEYTHIVYLARLLELQELKIVIQVMEKLIENRTNSDSHIVLEEYINSLTKAREVK